MQRLLGSLLCLLLVALIGACEGANGETLTAATSLLYPRKPRSL
jgi:hypothetical protein